MIVCGAVAGALGGAALATAVKVNEAVDAAIELVPWRARVFWRTVYFDKLQNAVDTMDAYLRGEYGNINVPQYGQEERIMVVRGGGQKFEWTDDAMNERVVGWVNEGGTLIARVVAYETMISRNRGHETRVGLEWSSTGRGSA
jgi:hypothetical protein